MNFFLYEIVLCNVFRFFCFLSFFKHHWLAKKILNEAKIKGNKR